MHPDDLPALDDTRTLSPELIAAYRADGHALIRGVLSPEEVAVYQSLIRAAAERYNTEKRRMEDRDTYGKAFLQIMNLWRADDSVRRFVLAKRMARIAADLMGVDNVRLYHDQALFKEAGGGPTPWHQDQYYWPLDSPNTITMWMPLVDISVDMGMLTFASGSHRAGAMASHEISDDSDREFDAYVQEQGFPVTRATTMRAGDATWHAGYTIHNAPGNASDRMREVMTVIYFADGARISEPANAWQANDRKTWLMDGPIGAPAASPLNPLLL